MQRFANLLQAVFFKEPFEFTLIVKFGNSFTSCDFSVDAFAFDMAFDTPVATYKLTLSCIAPDLAASEIFNTNSGVNL